MEVGESSSFKPSQAVKKPADAEDDDEIEKQKRMRRIARAKANQMTRPASPTASVQTLDQITEEERQEILKVVETEQTEGEVIDEAAIKKIVLNFEKWYLKNKEMRFQFPDAPEKFMESEVELRKILQEMHVLAPDYYPLLVKLNAIPSLLQLLFHDNTDIMMGTLELIQKMRNADILHESEEVAEALIEFFLHFYSKLPPY